MSNMVLLKKHKIHHESLFEKVCFQPGVSKHLYRFLKSSFWISCRGISRIFAMNICNQLEEMEMPFSFFARNQTIRFLKVQHLTLYGAANTKRLYWSVSEQIYPSLHVLVIRKSFHVGFFENVNDLGNLFISDKILLKKLVLEECTEILYGISFNPLELKEISLSGRINSDLISSVFTHLYRAPRLEKVCLERITWNRGAVEVLARINRKQSLKLHLQRISLNEYDFQNCKLTEFICVDNRPYNVSNTKELNISGNPNLELVHIEHPEINSFVLWNSLECLESMVSLTLCFHLMSMHKFLSFTNGDKNWLVKRLPSLRVLKLVCDTRSTLQISSELYVQNHKCLQDLKIKLPLLKQIHVYNLSKLSLLSISGVSNVVVSSAPYLQQFQLYSPICDFSVFVEQIPSLVNFVWECDYYISDISVSSLQLPWKSLENLSIPILLSEDKCNLLSGFSFASIFTQCYNLQSLKLVHHQYHNGKINNQAALDKMITSCAQIPNLSCLTLTLFEGDHLSITSGFPSLEILQIFNPSMKREIRIANLPSLMHCYIGSIQDPDIQYNIYINNLHKVQRFCLNSETCDLSIHLFLTQLPRLVDIDIPMKNPSPKFQLTTDSSMLCMKKIMECQDLLKHQYENQQGEDCFWEDELMSAISLPYEEIM